MLKYVINWTVWSIIALYALLLLITNLPFCQDYLGKKTAEVLGEKLGTEVSIGRIAPGFPNRLIIDDILILDQQRKKMLRVARLSTKIDILPFTKGKISISSAQLFGAQAQLYKQNALARPNFQFVLDSLASKDTTSHRPLDLRINSLIIRRSGITYDQWDVSRTEGHFNPKHLNVNNISAQIILKALTEDSIDVNVKRLGFHEHSGLDIDKLAFRLKAGRQEANLRNLTLQMPGTLLQVDSLTARYRLKDGQLDIPSLNYQGYISSKNITPSDLRCFFSPLKNLQRPIGIQLGFTGKDREIAIHPLLLTSETDELHLAANGRVNLQGQQPAWDARIEDLTLSDNMIDFLQKNVRGIPQEVKQIGTLQLNGNFSGEADGGLNGQGKIQTGIGNVALNFQIDGNKIFKGNIDTQGIDLKQLLNDNRLGLFAANLNLDGQLDKTINAQGIITELDYNDYRFSHIGFNGTYDEKGISGYLKIEDPNLSLEAEGALAQTAQQSRKNVNISGKIGHIAPKALKLTDQWGDAVFAGQIIADFTARTLNDAQGSIRISDFTMNVPDQPTYHLDNLLVTSGYDERQHYLSVISDFAKAELKGDFEYGTLAQSFINFIGSALPTLPGLPSMSSKADNDFTFNLHLYKTDWLQRLLGVDLSIRQPITLKTRVNDHSRNIYLEGVMPDFTYNGSHYANGMINITAPIDTIRCDMAFEKRMDNGQPLSISLKANAIDNQLNTSLRWDNLQPEQRISGDLNLTARLYRNLSNKPEAHIHVQPSHITLNNTPWNVDPADIIYAENDLHVDHFTIHNGLQHIIIDGRASKYNHDLLTIDLNDVEVAYILDLVNFHSVEFSGKASGTALVSAPFGDLDGQANITVDEFKFENGRMGTLYAQVDWNQEAKQIDIRALADDGPDAKTHIKGYVSPTYNTIDLGIRAEGTHLDFVHNFTSSFLSSITGQANGAVRLAGSLDNINLTGQLVIAEGEASVTALNTTYTFKNDTVLLVPDDILLQHMPLYDKYGNTGILSGGVHHEHLTNLSYDLTVNAANLLAYDFKDFGESTFYGTVFASGDVDIHGHTGEVTINCNVTPQRNSVFVYNAASPDAISNQEFIQWGGQAPITVRAKDQEEIDIPTDIYINFLINSTPEATLRLLMDENTNDYITLNGNGTIRATFYNKGPFNMFGTYTVDHGTYGITIQNIIKKNFTFNPGGTIIFGGDPYNAALNLQAVYTVNGVSLSDLNIGNSFASNTIRVNCLMNIGGQPNAPQVDFDLEMPTVNADEQQMVRSIINGQQEMNQQVLYLLGIGRFYNQGQNNASTSQQDQTSLAMQSFLSGTLSSQINSLLSTVIKNDNWNFGANISTGNEGWHNAEYEGLVSGRMLNNRLLLNGQFGYRDNARQATPSFIGDFDIQYLLYPNGNLALKVYNQTNDRYFTKSSLNTQGIGIIMKKDFNGLRDLFSGSKKKKTKAKKSQQ